jgi:hypothetical protein
MQHRLRWFRHIQRKPLETPVRSGVISWAGNGKKQRTREEYVMRDLEDWNITKELAVGTRQWRVAIHAPELSVPLIAFLC